MSIKNQADWQHLVDFPGNGSLIGHAIKEMKTAHNPTITSWFLRVEKIKTFLGLKYSTFSKIDVIKKQIKSKFEQFWLREINKIKLGDDNKNHNKFRFYASIKGVSTKSLI